jgi:hypothetical protein
VNAAIKKDDPNSLHDYEIHRKEIYDRNNARNVDLYGRAKYQVKDKKTGQTFKLVEYDKNTIDEREFRDVEDAYLDYIEYKEIEEMLMEYEEAMKEYSEQEQ